MTTPYRSSHYIEIIANFLANTYPCISRGIFVTFEKSKNGRQYSTYNAHYNGIAPPKSIQFLIHQVLD